jgi:hypothetical protein
MGLGSRTYSTRNPITGNPCTLRRHDARKMSSTSRRVNAQAFLDDGRKVLALQCAMACDLIKRHKCRPQLVSENLEAFPLCHQVVQDAGEESGCGDDAGHKQCADMRRNLPFRGFGSRKFEHIVHEILGSVCVYLLLDSTASHTYVRNRRAVEIH